MLNSARVGTVLRSRTPVAFFLKKVGYRFFDCAEFYGNEAEVGHALQASGVPRAELYLASKVWTTTIYNGPDAVKAQVAKTIQDLG